jgi:CheY-like chemotaxis protein
MPQKIVLHVEDEGEDAFFVRWAFQKAGIDCTVLRVRTGQECIDYLKGTGGFFERTVHPTPDLVLLDLKLPQVDGYDVLEWVRAQPEFRCLPVVVLTGYAGPEEFEQARTYGATCCFQKSPHYQGVVDYAANLFKSAEQTVVPACAGSIFESTA